MPMRDCTQPIRDGMPVYPGDPSVTVEPHATLEDDGVRVSALRLGTHTGTHVDAPSHTEPGGRTIDAFPPGTFRFDAVLVDCDAPAPRGTVGPDVLPGSVAGDPDLVVFRTGWEDRWGTSAYRDHPSLAPAVGEWCAARGLSIGIDALSPDPTPPRASTGDDSTGVPVHHAVLGAGGVIVENLTNLARLPARFTLHVLPLLVEGGDGAPVRAVADVPA